MNIRGRLEKLEGRCRSDRDAARVRQFHAAMERLSADPVAYELLMSLAERVEALGGGCDDLADIDAIRRFAAADPEAADLCGG